LRKDVFLPNAETNLGLYEKKLNQSGSGFLLRSGLTMVDFMVAEYMDTLRKDEPEFMAKYPEVVKYIDRVNSLPQLKEYIAKRKN
jgi:glutathione S-transferase